MSELQREFSSKEMDFHFQEPIDLYKKAEDEILSCVSILKNPDLESAIMKITEDHLASIKNGDETEKFRIVKLTQKMWDEFNLYLESAKKTYSEEEITFMDVTFRSRVMPEVVRRLNELSIKNRD